MNGTEMMRLLSSQEGLSLPMSQRFYSQIRKGAALYVRKKYVLLQSLNHLFDLSKP